MFDSRFVFHKKKIIYSFHRGFLYTFYEVIEVCLRRNISKISPKKSRNIIFLYKTIGGSKPNG